MKYIIPILTLSTLVVLAGCTTPQTANTNTVITNTNENNNIVKIENGNVDNTEVDSAEDAKLSQESLDWLGNTDIDVDNTSFEVIDEYLAKDANTVYYKYNERDDNGGWEETVKVLKDSDPSTFHILSKSYPRIARDANAVYFSDYRQDYRAVANIDSATFELLDNVNINDIVGQDDTSYLLVASNDEGYLVVARETYEQLDDTYSRDEKNVYMISGFVEAGYRILSDADPITFEVLGNGYARDSNAAYAPHILYEGRIINRLADADVTTFEVLSFRMAKDKNFIYNNGIRFEDLDVDVSSFQSYGNDTEFYYDKDDAYVFRANSGMRLDRLDAESLTIISEYGSREGIWWKDTNGVYTAIIEEINELKGEYELSYGKIDVDPESFTGLVAEDCDNVEYAKDCSEYDIFYSYQDKNGSYGFLSSQMVVDEDGNIPQQIIGLQ